MADFVTNFLEGLAQRDARQEREQLRQEQVRQFELNRLQRQREFDTETQLAKKRQAIEQARFQREGERQKLQDDITAANLISQGVADQSISGLDENVPGRFEIPGLDITMLAPEERSERETQLAIGNFRTRVNAATEQVRSELGEEAAERFKSQLLTPTNLAQVIGIQRPEREQRFTSQDQLAANIRAKQASGETLTDAEQNVLQAIDRERLRRASAQRPLVVGPEGQLTYPGSVGQQASSLATKLSPFATQLGGFTETEVLSNPQDAARLLAAGLIDARNRQAGPFAEGQPLEGSAPADRDLLGVAAIIIDDILRRNKQPKSSGFQLPGLEDLTQEEVDPEFQR